MMHTMNGQPFTIVEPARRVPVIRDVDVCVLGGSCTGAFAAVRAARLGARVALVEKQNALGGVATGGLVNVWHSLMDTEHRRPIIAGLTQEVASGLARRGACEEFGLPADAGWGGSIPNAGDVRMHAETRRSEAEYRLTEDDVLTGRRFDDAIANGSYRVDIHYPEGGGFLFKYLDGTQASFTHRGRETGRWRPETRVNRTFYQIPYRCMVHRRLRNLIMAGRMIAADAPDFGAIRVMVNMNQTGEAAADVPIDDLRRALADGGSLIL